MIPASDLWMLGLRPARGVSADPSMKGSAMSPKDSDPSPADRLMARRRTIFIRDWILVLIALGLAIAAGAFHRDPVQPRSTPSAISAAASR